ncbi:MAG: hypothetical protein ACU826_00910 [Gammaproteobacteria bacterium]
MIPKVVMKNRRDPFAVAVRRKIQDGLNRRFLGVLHKGLMALIFFDKDRHDTVGRSGDACLPITV